MCTAAILAGGSGRRLGGVLKPLIPLGGRRIIDVQLRLLQDLVDQVTIVATSAAPFRGLDVPVWLDRRPGTGPLGGILTALVGTATARTLVIAGDMPFLSAPFLRHLLQSGIETEADVIVPRTNRGYQPLCAIYARTCVERIEHQLDAGMFAVHDAYLHLRVHEIGGGELSRFDPDGTLFFNINTPEDVTRANALALQRRG